MGSNESVFSYPNLSEYPEYLTQGGGWVRLGYNYTENKNRLDSLLFYQNYVLPERIAEQPDVPLWSDSLS